MIFLSSEQGGNLKDFTPPENHFTSSRKATLPASEKNGPED